MAGLREELLAVRQKRGFLTPAIVVEEARDESHSLHSRFEWSDDVAAAKYREVQAAALIRSVRIVSRPATETEAERTVRGFVSVRRETGQAYEPTEEVAEDPFLKKLVLQDMRREWMALRRRFQDHAEFFDMIRNDLPGEEAA